MYPTPTVSRKDSLDEMPTPDTPYGRTWDPNPPPRVRKAYKRLLDSLPDEPPMKRPADPGTPIEEYYKRFQAKVSEEFKNFRVRTPVWYKKQEGKTSENANNVKDTQVAVRDGDQVEEETEITVPADKHGPLTGVVVCTAYKHRDQQRALYDAVVSLGGDYRWALDNTVTHFLFQGQTNDKTKEFRTAREEGKIIVSPEWVWMCRDENEKIDEELFPHTHNPKMMLSIFSKKVNTNNTRKGGPRKKHLSGDDKSEVTRVDEPDSAKATDEAVPGTSTTMNETLTKQLEEIEALASVCSNERRSLSRTKSVSEKLKHTPTREVQIETQPG